MSLIAKIANISRGSLHDGEGIRTVVYFKGCGLRCLWCHNPEALSVHADIIYAPVKCIGCGRCVFVCPVCHSVTESGHIYDRGKCSRCGRCAEACPTGALSVCGRDMTVDEVFAEIDKDRHYYDESGGGVTLSGGECLLQADFCAALLEKCRREKIRTALESAFFTEKESVEKVLPFTDFVYADLKIADSEKHRYYTGRGNGRIIENIRLVSERADAVTIRIPVIPGVNDGEEDIDGFGRIIGSLGGGVKSVELLRYNTLASSKYLSVGREYRSFGQETQTDDEMEILKDKLQFAAGKIPVFFRRT